MESRLCSWRFPTCADALERLGMQQAALATGLPCFANLGAPISSRWGRCSSGSRSGDAWNIRCGEVRGLKMSDSQSGRLIKKVSLGKRLLRKVSSRLGDSSVEAKVEGLAEDGSGPEQATFGGSGEAKPEHLVILVNGIWGSANNWIFTAQELKKKLGDNVVVHCSAANSRWKTHAGVDIMGKRLAEEVEEVIRQNPGLTKVSFVGHSLGGLIARYAIGKLYAHPGDESQSEAGGSGMGTIAGLVPVNFITLATPHLGCRGNKHLPFLLGATLFEWAAPFVSPLIIGPTGKHLFLADGNNGSKPLLQRMVTDCDEGSFLSALRCFDRRIAYANVCHDRMVGWRTASIRKATEQPFVSKQPGDDPPPTKYKYIVREENVPLATKDSSEKGHSEPKDAPALDDIEEGMVAGLQQVPWWRVDVDFSAADSLYEAHNLIQVKDEYWHIEGKYVIEHIIDKHFVGLQSSRSSIGSFSK